VNERTLTSDEQLMLFQLLIEAGAPLLVPPLYG